MPVRTTGDLLAGRYRVEKRLGAGGMAAVFLAHDERLDRKVALKRLHADSPEDVGRRFRREAKVGASLNHPNLVSVYDTVTDDEGVLIVMEFVDGHTMRDEMADGPLAPERVLEVLAGVARALDHAHEHGVVHRDVKPANILIDARGGAVKLADLGIATAAERTRITNSGTVLGTAAYMAPERLDGVAGGPPVDIYALAAVAYEALSGQKAFTGSSAIEIARRIATQEPPDLAESAPGAPARAAAVIKGGLAKDPAARPQSACGLVRELSDAYAAREQPAPAPPAPAPAAAPRRQTPAPAPARASFAPRRGALLGGLVALAAIAALIIALGLGGGSSSNTAVHHTQASSGKGTHHSGSSSSRRASGSGGANGSSSSASGGGSQSGGVAGGGSGLAAANGPVSTPQAAVEGFYVRAANGDFQQAWALASPRAQSQVGGFASWKGGEQDLKGFRFPKLQVTSQSGDSATVAFQSIAEHSGYTDHCSGSIDTVRQGGGWVVDQLHIGACTKG